MRQRLWAAVAVAFSGAVAGVWAQVPAVVRQLVQPADALCQAGKGKPILLKEFAKLIEKHHRIKVSIDDAAFKQAAPKMDWATARVTLPIKPGLRLATVLHYVLENDLIVPATFKIAGDTIVIHPGVTQVVQDEVKDGPLGKRLDATLMSTKQDLRGSVEEALTAVEKSAGLPILVASHQFVVAGRLDFSQQQVKIARQTKVPAAKFLRDILSQANATFQVKPDHILVVPKDKKK